MKTSQVIVTAGALGVLAISLLVHQPPSSGPDGSPPGSHQAALEASESNAGTDTGRSGSTSTSAASGGPGIKVGSTVATRDISSIFGPRRYDNSDAGRSVGASVGQLDEAAVIPPGDGGVIYDSGKEAQFSTDSRFQVPESGDISGRTGTISFQFEPGWSGDNQADASLVEIGDGRLLIRKNVSFLRFEMKDDDGNETGTGFNITEWEPGQPYHVTASWGGGAMLLYVDGKLAAEQRYASPFEIPFGTPVYLGTGPQNASIAPGLLTNVQLSKEALGPGDVAGRAARLPSQ